MPQAVILINTGSPLQADVWYIKSFLTSFMADKQVFRLPSPLHWAFRKIVPALHARKLQPAYAAIFRHGQSPQQHYMQELERTEPADCELHAAFLYAPPKLKGVLETLQRRGIEDITLLPLYPQYSGTTTGSACNKIYACLQTLGYKPRLKLVKEYWQEPLYIAGLAQCINKLQEIWGENFKSGTLYCSYHSLPASYLKDPAELGYIEACRQTTELLHMQCPELKMRTVFQSVFGPQRWQGPFLRDALLHHDYAAGPAAVICPGFALDCLETAYEIDLDLRAQVQAGRSESFTYLPCLNAGSAQRRLIRALTQKAQPVSLKDLLLIQRGHQALGH